MIKDKTGIWGEVYAARYLRDRGCRIVASNFRTRLGEIDIAAIKNEKELYIVEVKTRNFSTDRRPMEAVDPLKTEKLRRTAEIFIKASGLTLDPRFDVAEVYVDDENNLVSINYIENAFTE